MSQRSGTMSRRRGAEAIRAENGNLPFIDDVRCTDNAHSLGELGDSAMGANLEGRRCFLELALLDFLGVA